MDIRKCDICLSETAHSYVLCINIKGFFEIKPCSRTDICEKCADKIRAEMIRVVEGMMLSGEKGAKMPPPSPPITDPTYRSI